MPRGKDRYMSSISEEKYSEEEKYNVVEETKEEIDMSVFTDRKVKWHPKYKEALKENYNYIIDPDDKSFVYRDDGTGERNSQVDKLRKNKHRFDPKIALKHIGLGVEIDKSTPIGEIELVLHHYATIDRKTENRKSLLSDFDRISYDHKELTGKNKITLNIKPNAVEYLVSGQQNWVKLDDKHHIGHGFGSKEYVDFTKVTPNSDDNSLELDQSTSYSTQCSQYLLYLNNILLERQKAAINEYFKDNEQFKRYIKQELQYKSDHEREEAITSKDFEVFLQFPEDLKRKLKNIRSDFEKEATKRLEALIEKEEEQVNNKKLAYYQKHPFMGILDYNFYSQYQYEQMLSRELPKDDYKKVLHHVSKLHNNDKITDRLFEDFQNCPKDSSNLKLFFETKLKTIPGADSPAIDDLLLPYYLSGNQARVIKKVEEFLEEIYNGNISGAQIKIAFDTGEGKTFLASLISRYVEVITRTKILFEAAGSIDELELNKSLNDSGSSYHLDDCIKIANQKLKKLGYDKEFTPEEVSQFVESLPKKGTAERDNVLEIYAKQRKLLDERNLKIENISFSNVYKIDDWIKAKKSLQGTIIFIDETIFIDDIDRKKSDLKNLGAKIIEVGTTLSTARLGAKIHQREQKYPALLRKKDIENSQRKVGEQITLLSLIKLQEQLEEGKEQEITGTTDVLQYITDKDLKNILAEKSNKHIIFELQKKHPKVRRHDLSSLKEEFADLEEKYYEIINRDSYQHQYTKHKNKTDTDRDLYEKSLERRERIYERLKDKQKVKVEKANDSAKIYNQSIVDLIDNNNNKKCIIAIADLGFVPSIDGKVKDALDSEIRTIINDHYHLLKNDLEEEEEININSFLELDNKRNRSSSPERTERIRTDVINTLQKEQIYFNTRTDGEYPLVELYKLAEEKNSVVIVNALVHQKMRTIVVSPNINDEIRDFPLLSPEIQEHTNAIIKSSNRGVIMALAGNEEIKNDIGGEYGSPLGVLSEDDTHIVVFNSVEEFQDYEKSEAIKPLLDIAKQRDGRNRDTKKSANLHFVISKEVRSYIAKDFELEDSEIEKHLPDILYKRSQEFEMENERRILKRKIKNRGQGLFQYPDIQGYITRLVNAPHQDPRELEEIKDFLRGDSVIISMHERGEYWIPRFEKIQYNPKEGSKNFSEPNYRSGEEIPDIGDEDIILESAIKGDKSLSLGNKPEKEFARGIEVNKVKINRDIRRALFLDFIKDIGEDTESSNIIVSNLHRVFRNLEDYGINKDNLRSKIFKDCANDGKFSNDSEEKVQKLLKLVLVDESFKESLNSQDKKGIELWKEVEDLQYDLAILSGARKTLHALKVEYITRILDEQKSYVIELARLKIEDRKNAEYHDRITELQKAKRELDRIHDNLSYDDRTKLDSEIEYTISRIKELENEKRESEEILESVSKRKDNIIISNDKQRQEISQLEQEIANKRANNRRNHNSFSRGEYNNLTQHELDDKERNLRNAIIENEKSIGDFNASIVLELLEIKRFVERIKKEQSIIVEDLKLTDVDNILLKNITFEIGNKKLKIEDALEETITYFRRARYGRGEEPALYDQNLEAAQKFTKAIDDSLESSKAILENDERIKNKTQEFITNCQKHIAQQKRLLKDQGDALNNLKEVSADAKILQNRVNISQQDKDFINSSTTRLAEIRQNILQTEQNIKSEIARLKDSVSSEKDKQEITNIINDNDKSLSDNISDLKRWLEDRKEQTITQTQKSDILQNITILEVLSKKRENINEELTRRISTLESKNQSDQEKLKNAQDRLTKLEKEHTDLNNNFSDLTSSVDNLVNATLNSIGEEQYVIENDSSKSIKERYESRKEKINETQTRLKSRELRQLEIAKAYDTIYTKLGGTNPLFSYKELSDQKTLILELVEKNTKSKNAENQELSNENTGLFNKNKILLETIDELQQKFNFHIQKDRQGKISQENLKKWLEGLEQQKKNNQKQISKLKESEAALIKQQEEDKAKNSSLVKENQQISAQRDLEKTRADQNNTLYQQEMGKIKGMRADLAKKDSKIADLKTKKDASDQKVKTLTTEKDELASTLKAKNSEYSKLEAELSAAKKEVTSKQNDILSLRKQIAKIQAQLNVNIEESGNKENQSKDNLRNLQAELEDLKSRHQDLVEQEGNKRIEIVRLNGILDALKSEKTTLAGQYQESENGLEQAKIENKKLQASITEQLKETQNISAQFTAEKSAKENLEKTTNSKIKSLEDKLKANATEIDSLREQLNRLNELLKGDSSQSDEADAIEVKLRKLIGNREDLEKKLAKEQDNKQDAQIDHDTALIALKEEKESVEAKLTEAQESLGTIKKEKDALSESEKNQKVELKKITEARDKAQSELDAKNSEITELRDNVNDKQGQIEKITDEKKLVDQRVEELTAQLKKLQQDNESTENEQITSLKSQLAESQASQKNLQYQIEKLNTESGGLLKYKEALEKDKKYLEKTIEHQNQQISSKQALLDAIKSKLEDLENENKRLKEAEEQLKEREKELKSEKSALETKHKQEQDENNEKHKRNISELEAKQKHELEDEKAKHEKAQEEEKSKHKKMLEDQEEKNKQEKSAKDEAHQKEKRILEEEKDEIKQADSAKQKIITDLESQIANITKLISELQKKKDNTQKNQLSVEELIKEVADKISEDQQSIKDKNAEIERLEKQIADLKKEPSNNNITQNTEENDEEIKRLQTELENSAKELQSKEDELNDSIAAKGLLEEKQKELEEKITKINQDLQSAQENNKKLQQTLTEQLETNLSLQGNISQLEDDKKTVEKELAGKEEELNVANKTISNLQSEKTSLNNDIEKKAAELEAIQRTILEYTTRISQLEGELKRLREEQKEKNSSDSDTEEEDNKNKADQDNLSKRIKDLEEELKTAKADNETFKTEAETIKAELETAKTAKDEVEAKLTKANEEKTALQTEFDTKKAELEAKDKELIAQRTKYDLLEEDIKEQRKKNDSLNADNTILKVANATLTEKNKAAEETKKELKQSLVDQKEAGEKTLAEEKARAQKENEGMEAEKQALKTDLEQQRAEHKKLIDKEHKQAEELAAARQKIEDTDKEITTLREEKKKSEKKIKELEARIKELEALLKQDGKDDTNSTTLKEITTLKEEKVALEKEKLVLEKQNGERDKTITLLQSEKASQEKEITRLANELREAKRKEEEKENDNKKLQEEKMETAKKIGHLEGQGLHQQKLQEENDRLKSELLEEKAKKSSDNDLAEEVRRLRITNDIQANEIQRLMKLLENQSTLQTPPRSGDTNTNTNPVVNVYTGNNDKSPRTPPRTDYGTDTLGQEMYKVDDTKRKNSIGASSSTVPKTPSLISTSEKPTPRKQVNHRNAGLYNMQDRSTTSQGRPTPQNTTSPRPSNRMLREKARAIMDENAKNNSRII